MRSYGLTNFIVLYLVGELLRTDKSGRTVLDDPGPLLRIAKPDKTRDELESKLLQEVNALASYVVTELNYYVEDQGGEVFDYKSVFKSERGVKLLRSEVLKAYEKDRFRDKVDAFKMPQASASVAGNSKSASTASKKKVKSKKPSSK